MVEGMLCQACDWFCHALRSGMFVCAACGDPGPPHHPAGRTEPDGGVARARMPRLLTTPPAALQPVRQRGQPTSGQGPKLLDAKTL